MTAGTFDPLRDMPTLAEAKVSYSPYAENLEKVAPGIIPLIDSTQAVGEEWPQTLERLVITLDATDEQKGYLMNAAESATKGLPPPEIPGEAATEAASKKNLLLVGGAIAAMLFFG